MAGQLLLGIDIGTYSAKGVLCTPDGQLLASETIEHELSLPRPGWAEHDAETIWWGQFVALSRKLLSGRYRGADVGAVAVSAIGACMLPVDRSGRPLRAGILYGIDTRAAGEIDWLNERFPPTDLLALGGMALSTQSIGPKILWLKRQEPEIYERTHKFLTASSFVIQRLTGEFVIDRHTASYFNPLIDITSLEWDDRFAEPIVELDRLPTLRWSNEVAGTVTRVAANETGLAAGTPVTAGAVDAAAEALSVGVMHPGDMMIMYGTTMFFILVTDRPIPDERMWSTAYLFPGLYDIAGGMATSGALTRWFRDEFGGAELATQQRGGPDAYESLAELALRVPAGAEGLVCLPYFSGERTPINDPLARGVFAGLTLSHTRGHLYRAVLEGTAFGVRDNLEAIQEMGISPRRLVAVGGGSRNPLWLQIVSDATRLPQDLPEQTIGAAYGDAFLAGIATGIIPDLDALATHWVTIERTLQSDQASARLYDEYFTVYRRLYQHSKDELHDLARLGFKDRSNEPSSASEH